ncbi:hypothetical protein R3P38DRAFT_3292251 [Favolaschia claudopus]|uniref:BRCT domain-containing protein n=1 Tax=Favolaschia claudopus TaxID=2862362 RepID=A0AAV9ZKY8_9AGAR
MAAATQPIFTGMVYYIDPHTSNWDLVVFSLDENDAEETTKHADATRIIVDRLHYSRYEPSRCRGIFVTPEWVYASVKCGAKRPSEYYSPDPAMFFSSIVVTAYRMCAADERFIYESVSLFGGQYTPTLTDDTTHLVVDPTSAAGSDFYHAEFRPIVVSSHWIRDCIANHAPLPVTDYLLLPQDASNSDAEQLCALQRFVHKFLNSGSNTEYLDGYLSTTEAPFPSLPFEIMAEIFIVFRDDALDEELPCLTDMQAVSQVCRRWRDVSLAIPELWARIPLNFHSNNHFARLKNLLTLWLERSTPRPLALTIRSCYPDTENPIIQFLLCHARRIRELSLDIPAAHYLPLFSAPAGSFPLLQRLSVTVIDKCDATYDPQSNLSRHQYFCLPYEGWGGCSDGPILWEDTPAAAFACFQHLPSLHSIRVEGSAFTNLDCRMFALDWSTLTDVDLEFVALDVVQTAYLLPQLTHVECLKFATDPDEGISVPAMSAVLERLTTLNWNNLDIDDVSLFEQLTLPRLISLDLRDASWQSLHLLHSHSRLKLQKLSLVFVSIELARLKTLLREMPSLVDLGLYRTHGVDLTEELFRFFMYHRNDNPVLPNLRYLVLTPGEPACPGSEVAMVEMLESRWRLTPLKKVRISPREEQGASLDAHSDIRRRIVRLVEEGLELTYND